MIYASDRLPASELLEFSTGHGASSNDFRRFIPTINPDELTEFKLELVGNEQRFLSVTGQYFTEFYQPLYQWVNMLRRKVIQVGKPSDKKDLEMFGQMKQIFKDAQEDIEVQ